MTSSLLIRRALHLLLLVSLILPITAWPARAAATPLPAAATTTEMPCHDGMPATAQPHSEQPCEEGCCPQPTCDLSACLATALLPRFASPSAPVPPVPFVFPWRSAAPAARTIDTPLRPPIS